jgi:hypothetical protein
MMMKGILATVKLCRWKIAKTPNLASRILSARGAFVEVQADENLELNHK